MQDPHSLNEPLLNLLRYKFGKIYVLQKKKNLRSSVVEREGKSSRKNNIFVGFFLRFNRVHLIMKLLSCSQLL